MLPADIKNWYQRPPGIALMEYEQEVLDNVLSKLFGYYIVQIGGPTNGTDVLSASRIHNHIYVNPETFSTNSLPVQCNPEELPFLPESIDAMVVLHVLEFAKKPTLILKEIYESLIPGGYVVISGFNPYSLWGVAKLWNRSKKSIWGGNWFSPRRLRCCLLEIGFTVGDYQSFYFSPSNESAKKNSFLETMGKIFWPSYGAGYMFVAQKTSLIVTPLNKIKSFIKHPEVAKALPKPTSRGTQCNRNQDA